MKNVCYLFWFFLEKNVGSFFYKDFLSFLYIHVHKIYKKILDKYIYIYIFCIFTYIKYTMGTKILYATIIKK